MAHGPDRVPNIFLPVWPNSVNKHFIIWPPRFSLFFIFFFSGNKPSIGMLTYVAYFDRKVGIYIATKLFQFTSCKEPSNPIRTDGFFRRCSHHRVQRPYGDFLNRFAIKARVGPYVSFHKLLFIPRQGLVVQRVNSALHLINHCVIKINWIFQWI